MYDRSVTFLCTGLFILMLIFAIGWIVEARAYNRLKQHQTIINMYGPCK